MQNYRAAKDLAVDLDRNLTILLGPNGSGKTTVMDAIHTLFHGKSITAADYHGGGDDPIRITADLRDVDEDLVEKLTPACRITREAGADGTGALYATITSHPLITEILGDGLAAMRRRYLELDGGEFPGLPDLGDSPKKADIEYALYEWQQRNPRMCTAEMDVNISEADIADLEPFVVGAQRDPAVDAGDDARSVLSRLADRAVQRSAEGQGTLDDLKNKIRSLYDMHASDHASGLDVMSSDITHMLDPIEGGVGIRLFWREVDPSKIPSPRAGAVIIEDGYPNEIEKAGHGAQRLFLYGMLRFYHEMTHVGLLRTGYTLAIDEPELHQHPARQDAFYRTLRDLAHGSQVIYVTHSDRFVSVDDVPRLRLFTKSGGRASVRSTSFEEIAAEAASIDPRTTAERVKRRLSTTDTPEFRASLFSRTVVLVEGPTDMAIIETVADLTRRNLATYGISIVPCNGKANIREQVILYRLLGIRCYVVWDLDQKKKPKRGRCSGPRPDPKDLAWMNHDRNRRIYMYMGLPPPSRFHKCIKATHSCFHGSIEDQLSAVGAATLEMYKREVREALYLREFNDKSPYVVSELVRRIYRSGARLEGIERMLGMILGKSGGSSRRRAFPR